jgi:hypothetical protein
VVREARQDNPPPPPVVGSGAASDGASDAEPSRDIWKVTRILRVICQCVARKSGRCTHACSALFVLVNLPRPVGEGVAGTSILCRWVIKERGTAGGRESQLYGGRAGLYNPDPPSRQHSTAAVFDAPRLAFFEWAFAANASRRIAWHTTFYGGLPPFEVVEDDEVSFRNIAAARE